MMTLKIIIYYRDELRKDQEVRNVLYSIINRLLKVQLLGYHSPWSGPIKESNHVRRTDGNLAVEL